MTKKRILATAIVLAILCALVYLQVRHWRSFDWAKFRHASHVHPLQIASAVGLTGIDILYVARQVIPPVYLADAGAEILLLAAWAWVCALLDASGPGVLALG